MSSNAKTPAEMFCQFVQIGVVVRDLDRTLNNLTRIFNVGPFRVIDWPPPDRLEMERYYHGEPGNFTARMAFAELGPVELEIIQPVSGQNVWTDFLNEHGEGIHHIRFNVDDEKEVIDYLAQNNIQPIQSGSGLRPGTFWVLFGTQEAVGFIFEIMRAVPGTDGRTPQFSGGKVIA